MAKERQSDGFHPLVSVVIPTHNRSDRVIGAIASALAQSHPVHEVIVVDDGSTDDTRERVAAIGDPRVRYLQLPVSRGGGAARNVGITAAEGEWVAFLDDDDEWLPDKLARQLAAAAGYDALLCGAAAADSRRREVPRGPITRRRLRRGFPGVGTSILIARTAAAKRCRFDESLPMGQDWDFLIRFAERYRIGAIPDILVRYSDGDHRRISNQSAELSTAEARRRMAVIEKHRLFLGSAWYDFHAARMLLYRWRSRQRRWSHLFAVAAECGWRAVALAMLRRIWENVTSRARELRWIMKP